MGYEYDVAILGGGPGGYVAAIKAAQHGLKTALIEKGPMGGTCLNVGCIPTKALIACAEALRSAKGLRDFGVTAENVSFDFAKMMARKERVVKQLRTGVEFLMKKNAVTVFTGEGMLTGPHSLGVGDQEITARAIILASGSVPARPPIPGLDGANVVTSNEILSWPEVPGALTVIGGGAIGLEFAFMFSTVGSKVTVLEALPHILPQDDAQVAAELTTILKRQGIAIQAEATVTEIADADGKKVVRYAQGGEQREAVADVVLAAMGRWPFTEGCGYEAQGIRIERRAVQVDPYLHTGVADIYAIGDVVGGMMLAHKASMEAAVAVENIVGARCAMEYHAIPSALYSVPGVASVGFCEADAIAAGYEVKVGQFPFRILGKALATGEREGFVKVVIDAANGVVLGVQAIGPHVSDMITEASMAVQHRLTAEQFTLTVHPHPTLSEGFHEAMEVALGHPVHM
jgi:dihydrolipoamide dehydrogenase